jgi:DNA-binding IclR family transcriptional regulator
MRTLTTVDRALQLLISFDVSGQQQLTVAALASSLGVHRSSASRLAATLAQRGFLERVADGEGFRLGPVLGRLGLLAIADRDLLSESRTIMERLASETGETVVLSLLQEGDAVDVAQASGRHLVGVHDWIGRRSPLHASSDGKVFLAFSDARAADPLAGLTEHTITDPRELADQIDTVRARGWATVEGELEEGLNGVAAPVFDGTSRCVAALSVSGPAYRLSPTRLAAVADALVAASAGLAERLRHISGPLP